MLLLSSRNKLLNLVILGFITGVMAVPYSFSQSLAPQSGQTLPDAPAPKNTGNNQQVAPAPPPKVPANTQDYGQIPVQTTTQGTTDTPQTTPPPAMPPVKTVPPGSVKPEPNNQDELFKLVVNTNFVVVPVTVKNGSGHLQEGLLEKDFEVLEDNKPQQIRYFTSDPFALSAAVVLDLSLPDTVISKVNRTYPAMVGAFGQYDEVSLFTYANSVQRVQDFVGATSQKFSLVMKRVSLETRGRQGGVPVVAGPMAAGPSTNGHPIEMGTPGEESRTYQPEPHVLNDALLAAAMDLSRRPAVRRKIIFVISDGRELDSDASYRDVLKVLQTYQILVYAVNVGGGGIPGYRDLEKLKIPGQGYGNILTRYAAATGGQVYPAVSTDAIENAYQRLTSEARNQYTLGYMASTAPSGKYREIEVRVKRPDMKVIARQGYYPLPPPQAPKP